MDSDQEMGGIVDKRASARMNNEADQNEQASGDNKEPESVTIEDLRRQLDEEKERSQSHYANWQRSAADFINYKRRVEKEQQEAARYASIALVINLLPVVDDFERAMDSVDAHLAGLGWVQGVGRIHEKLRNLLTAYGVEEIKADGEMFDPRYHEAISQAPGEENKVLAVVQKGYRFGDRVLRPAMVVVGTGEEPAKEGEASAQDAPPADTAQQDKES